ncbi:MAG TPA: hypothetical protein VFZ25_21280, partial [Chloroflexota bacterium]|nr:hypothetical protein [Chloroflexota bacterium]
MARFSSVIFRVVRGAGARPLIALLLTFALVVAGTSSALAWTVYLPIVANGSSPPGGPAKPPTSASYYILSTDPGRAYPIGCQQGSADAQPSPPVNSLVVLDFGGQLADGSGSLLVSGTPVSNAQIAAIAEAFAHGYWYCTGSDYTSVLTLVVGTNNSYYDVSYGGGQTWARTVAAIAAYNQSHGYSAQVVVDGGNDIEPAWADAPSSRAWADGFSSVGSAFSFNYGTADGCPTTSYLNGRCANGWSQSDVWYVSWGSSAALTLPEIYYPVNASQWTMIGLYGAEFHGSGGSIHFSGPLDTYPLWHSSNTADQAWSQFWSSLNGYS